MNLARRALVATLVVSAAILPFTTPAHAHHGYAGPAVLYLESVRLEPAPAGWVLRAALNDSKSGQAAPGFFVEAAGAGPEQAAFGPLHLTDTDADGRYEAPLGELLPGDWSLSLDIGDAPGGERAIPLRRSWTVALNPGLPVEVLGAGPVSKGSESSSSAIPTTLALAAGATLLALTATGLKRRRVRSASPLVQPR